ncbi:Regulator of nonsense transcripts 1 [Hibiscus syriacus]|uniref:Regulator of nonsense transcripts 1 n=1 Tax=Hibiscus syriacus TaxID=106335 RepID=A0A6A3BCM2_HIBSY|nr:putative invertase inhibitor [Hibiscus syriacus]KAE8713781.1 Regulator of nonsense transcripts 1 [Hibiscus syriacus]
MKNYLISCIVFFHLLIVSVRSDVLNDSCSQAAKGDPNINFDFCVSSLQVDPKAKSATSVADLVDVAIDTAMSNATSIGSIISKLLSNKSLEQYARTCLEDCSELYSDAGSNLKSGEQAFEGKDYGTANSEISAAMDAADTCEEQFKEKEGVVSPLTKENGDFFQLTAISLAFINMVQKR